MAGLHPGLLLGLRRHKTRNPVSADPDLLSVDVYEGQAPHPVGACGEMRKGGVVWEGMKKNFLLSLISIVLVTSCTNPPEAPVVATAPVATPTPENYRLYTDLDLQIYSETIDLKIRQALKNNNPSLAQDLGRKRQELIAEFNRRGLKRKPAQSNEPARNAPHSPTRKPPTPKQPGTGLPGQD